MVDSRRVEFSIPDQKVAKIKKECRHLANKASVTGRDLAHLIGLLSSVNLALLPGPLHYRALQRLKHKAIKSSFDTPVNLDSESLEDLDFWIRSLDLWNARAIEFPVASLVISSDASNTGWGACSGERSVSGHWMSSERKEHIDVLELKAAFFGLKSFVSS